VVWIASSGIRSGGALIALGLAKAKGPTYLARAVRALRE
jgi:hypothetical protein